MSHEITEEVVKKSPPVDTKPTLAEQQLAARNKGRLPDSYFERIGEAVPATEEAAVADPKTDNDFDALPGGTKFPYHLGGGFYFLSNGEKVRGKDAAENAEAQLGAE
jgi:hypothetical protein